MEDPDVILGIDDHLKIEISLRCTHSIIFAYIIYSEQVLIRRNDESDAQKTTKMYRNGIKSRV